MFNRLDKYKGKVAPVNRKTETDTTQSDASTNNNGQPVGPSSEQANVPGKSLRKTAALLNASGPVDVAPDAQPEATPEAQPQQAQAQPAQPTLDENIWETEDNENNIIFLDKHSTEAKSFQASSTTDSSDNNSQDEQQADKANNLIRGATLVKLVERVTSEKYADTLAFQGDYLLTFRSFTTPQDLLKLMISRYNMAPPKGLSYGQLQEWKTNKQKPIRLRIINFLKNWLDRNWIDFIEDPALGNALSDFLNTDVMNSGNQTSAEQLGRLLQKKRDDPNKEREAIFSTPPPKPMLPNVKKTSASSNSFGLMDFNSEEIARQLTLIEFNLYRAIKPWEFFNQSWTKKNKEQLSPNIISMIKRFNRVSGWVATEIVKTDKLKDRIAVLVKFIEIGERCRFYNNFNALMAIVGGLGNSSIFRLKQTWAGLNNKQRELFEELKELMSRQQNFQKLRAHMKNVNPPIIPYLGIFLTDLTFIEDGNPDMIENGTLINWVKRRRLAAVLKDIQQYQQKPFNLEAVPFIQDYLLNYEPLDEDQSYKLSLQRETRAPDAGNDSAKKSSGGLFGRSKTDEKKPASDPKDTKNRSQSTVPAKATDDDENEDDEFELQYKQGYKFYEKDSEQNIIIEKKDDRDIIQAGLLAKLCERLTYEKYPDINYLTAFMLTYRTFVTPTELLDLIIMRYNVPPPTTTTPEVLEKFKQKKELPIQLRVLNVLKTWVEKFFDDFNNDKALLTKLLEFVDKSMVTHPTMSRAGENLKAQIVSKLEQQKEEGKKAYQFDKEPPQSILPTAENPTLLDYSPVELARQLTLMDFELFTAIKPLEYLYLSKGSNWSMLSEVQEEEDPNNIKNSPHIVAVIYRFTDLRDWVATEIIKCEAQEQRAKVIEQFILIAENCATMKNFQAVTEIITSLSFDFVLGLKSTWKIVPPNIVATFIQLRELVSFRNNYKLLRDRLAKIDYPCIPFLGMYMTDLAVVREQMPDVIEPRGFINFAKRQKLSNLITEIYNYQQQPFCLQPVASVQDFLKALDIYEVGEMRALSLQYQEAEGDTKITETWVDLFEKKTNAPPANAPVVITPAQSSEPSPRNSSSPHFGNSPRGSLSPEGTNKESPRNSVLIRDNSVNAGSPRSSVQPGQKPVQQSSSSGNVTQQPAQQQQLDPAVLKQKMLALLNEDAEFKNEVFKIFEKERPAPEPVQQQQAQSPAPVKKAPVDVDALLKKEFPGLDIQPWNTMDNQATVYGWPEDIQARIIKNGNEVLVVPLLFDNDLRRKIDKPELAVLIRVWTLYESMNRMMIMTQGLRTKLVVIGEDQTEFAAKTLSQMGFRFVKVD